MIFLLLLANLPQEAMPVSDSIASEQTRIESSTFNRNESIGHFIGQPMQIESSGTENWKIILVLCWLFVAAITKLFLLNYVGSLLGPFISINKANVFYRQSSTGFQSGSLILILNFLLANTILAFIVFRHESYFTSISDGELIFYIIFVFGAINLLHNLAVQYVHFLFRPGDLLLLYNFHIGLIQQISGILLSIIACLALVLSTEIGYFVAIVGLIISASLLSAGVIRSAITLQRQSNLSSLHLFLYICTLEIAPLAVAIKGFIWISTIVI